MLPKLTILEFLKSISGYLIPMYLRKEMRKETKGPKMRHFGLFSNNVDGLLSTCDHWQKSTQNQGCTSQSGAEDFLVNDHDQAANAVHSIKCSCDHGIFGQDVEKVVIDIESFGDILEAFEVGDETKSRYANESVIDPSVRA